MSYYLRALTGVVSPLLLGALVLIGGIGSGAAPPVRAEEKAPLDWLRQQPLTLFDWGLYNLRRDMDRVALWVADSSLSYEKPLVGSQYDWRSGRVVAYISFIAPPKRRTHTYCHMVFARSVAQLMKGAPEGGGQASWYLASVFLPRARSWIRPSRDFGERLVKKVYFEVVLRPGPQEFRTRGPRVRCSGRLDASATELKDEVTH